MNITELVTISSFLDPFCYQAPVVVKAQTMARINSVHTHRLCQLFFRGQDEVVLTRDSIFRARNGNIECFILSVLFWGFPNNQRGRCSAAMNHWDDFVALSTAIRHHRNMTHAEFANYFDAMDAIRGLGISSYSKILYFLQATIDGNRCIILDDMVARGILNLEGEELDPLRTAVIGRYRYYRNYNQYISEIHNLNIQYHIPEDNIEYVLWLAGKKNH